jgi:hypothetical protein
MKEVTMGLVKGICYDGFPAPYDPSTANKTCIFFGSDAAYDAMAPLWGQEYTSSKGSECHYLRVLCREDVHVMKNMGVELIRLYDWEPRNRHLRFLDSVSKLEMLVLAPVSCYFLGAGFNDREKHIPALIKSFANAAGTDYHPAVAGVIFGNEFDGYNLDQCIQFTKDWVRIEEQQFRTFRKVRLGHPFAFIPTDGEKFPCFGYWKKLVPALASIKGRLFLAPQTYNDRTYLFQNAESSGKGWVAQAWEKFGTPILFTEIGQSRMGNATADAVVKGQLNGVRDYANSHPDRLLGACHFQFLDKVWMKGTTEGSFGAFTHTGQNKCIIHYGPKDFTHWDVNCDNDFLNVETLTPTPIYNAVKSVYNP